MDDFRDHLLRISVRHDQPIIPLLLAIQENRVQQDPFLSNFLSKLECFVLDSEDALGKTLLRVQIDAFKTSDYIALSYTWTKSDDENGASGCYQIQSRDGHRYFPSRVRNCVFDRITKYMRHKRI